MSNSKSSRHYDALWLDWRPAPEKMKVCCAQTVNRILSLEPVELSGTGRAMRNNAVTELTEGMGIIMGKELDTVSVRSLSGQQDAVVLSVFSDIPAEYLPQGDSQDMVAEGFRIYSCIGNNIVITSAHEEGILHGAFAFLRKLQCGDLAANLDMLDILEEPSFSYRMLDHWDNPDGKVERGYAGNSIWRWKELPSIVSPRYHDYGRLCASVGINACALNNVNADACFLTREWLEKVAVVSGILSEWGIRVFLSVNFAAPLRLGDLETADPLDSEVRAWWRGKVDEIYQLIPGFGGFLVKADSEGQAGPLGYGRSQEEGTNILADALAPHGGLLIWRAFVYGYQEKDRAAKAYDIFKSLDGLFRSNVALQVKNGPIDFQPREPVHPLLGSMDKTHTFLEVQVTQEYLGQGNHIVFLAPMWKEILEFDTLLKGKGSTIAELLSTKGGNSVSGMAGVANVGDDYSWCGSPLHPANWYAFGRLAWDCTASSSDIAREWTLCTWGHDPEIVEVIMRILLHSWEACIDYMTPLGLHHIMRYEHHYGPDPACDEGEREDWKPKYYHRADAVGLGFDRTRIGSGAVDQYAPPVADMFNDIVTCPQEYLLWFHHVPWSHTFPDGRTLMAELAFRYHRGVESAEEARQSWETLENKLPQEKYREVKEKLDIQVKDAHEWEDVCITYFSRFERIGKKA
ncbi:alpha-glucuronidase family glycosyl hydrolase [Parasphaerochaeta coccoides]|uniref:Xylan alpha-1,2-glucuronidase n=1 Tax=Parasphaerochaeta coccoides (strain ATCC BAA-1237 / DSM 17374 / SPN1) TaxID=760011 RepID=F4GLG9_PARC1|nr:alpha-glucuronidase family glycosyl hydrolase [Parasphaerochaeta coccoides]AEC01939.1 Alpha-glucuronidase [Parasphaerochaeta coccoides DSM 17374]